MVLASCVDSPAQGVRLILGVSVPLVYVSVLRADALESLYLWRKLWSQEIYSLALFIFKIILAVQGPLRLDRNFRMIFFLMWRKYPWDFERTCVESVGHSGWYWHLGNMKSSNPWSWAVCPFICPFIYVFFKFFYSFHCVILSLPSLS